MYKFGFVVLNYNTYDFTEDFIKSVKKNVKLHDYSIIIVDNDSPDKSGNILKEKYLKDDKITVIINNENYGFSKGNNIGIRYAIKTLNCDFVVMTNSDTCIIDNSFCDNIIEEYNNSKAAIIGPEINNPDGGHQYPSSPFISAKVLNKELFSLRLHYLLNKISLDGIYSKILNGIKNKENNLNFKNERKENVILHGSCIIFTPKYFEGNSVGIPEKTKFYCEEQFIYLYAQKKGFKIVYNPNIKILHRINGATKKTYINEKNKNNFKYQNKINSTKKLIKYLKEEKEKDDKDI